MYKLESKYKPTGDQPEAIRQLVEGVQAGAGAQTLLGVTGSGKTFTVANVIAQLNRPTLILSHNKTLAAQLYSEMKTFFPHNAVEYFVSYYDYYQPEAYIPSTDTYIEKDLSVNMEIDRLRLSATAALLSGRRDVIVISSVSCLYGIGNPQDFTGNTITLHRGDLMPMDDMLKQLVGAQYKRNDLELGSGTFRVKGGTVDIALPYTSDQVLRVEFFGNEVDRIAVGSPFPAADAAPFPQSANAKGKGTEWHTGNRWEEYESYCIAPATIFLTSPERIAAAKEEIKKDLAEQILYFTSRGEDLYAERLEQRVKYDLEMIEELGYCSGVENYSRYFDGRPAGSHPYTLLDYFPEDMLLVIDESHVTVPQIHAMYGGDRARKENLVNYGFRLPAARDNRPLKFEEWEGHFFPGANAPGTVAGGASQRRLATKGPGVNAPGTVAPNVIFLSATPAEYELEKSHGIVVDQVIRPTGLLDPEIEVRPSENQVDDLMDEIKTRIHRGERTLVTTLTKRMAEEMDDYLRRYGIQSAYIHSDIDTIERVKILEDLRKGVYDVLVGVNLLREGLDLPEVSLVAILDADKEGFLRDKRSMTQTVGRAARHVNGKAILYADKITASMQACIDETARRRAKQIAYNEAHGITPTAIKKEINTSALSVLYKNENEEKERVQQAIRESWKTAPWQKMNAAELKKACAEQKRRMLAAAQELDFLTAAKLRDELLEMEARMEVISP